MTSDGRASLRFKCLFTGGALFMEICPRVYRGHCLRNSQLDIISELPLSAGPTRGASTRVRITGACESSQCSSAIQIGFFLGMLLIVCSAFEMIIDHMTSIELTNKGFLLFIYSLQTPLLMQLRVLMTLFRTVLCT